MKRQFKLNLSIVMAANLMLPAPLAWAQGLNTQNATTTVTTTNNGTGLNGQTVTNINTSGMGMQNIDQLALEAAKKQKQGQMMAMMGAAFSGAMAAMTCPQKPPNPTCPLWILGAMSSLAIGGAMGKANLQSMQGYNNVTDGSPTDTPETAPTDQTQTERQVVEAANAAGLTPDMRTGTLKFPDGRTIGVEDLANNQTMAAAGMTNDEISGFNDVFAKAMKEGQKAAAKDATKGGTLDGAGGGAGNSLKGSDIAGGNSGLKVSRDPAQIAGLSKNFNGDRIGVASENLFTLINRRYEYKAQQNNFLVVPATTTKPQ